MKKRSKAKQRANLLPVILIAAGALLVLLVLVLQFAQSPENETQAQTTSDVQRVSMSDAKTAFDGQSAVFLDVRDAASFQAGHVPGAVNISVAELETRAAELDPSQWIIPYCT